MRKDMFEVIIERPRNGRWSDERKGRYSDHNKSDVRNELDFHYSGNDEESGIYSGRKETMRPKGRGVDRKSLNENLAPLRRFLQSSIGKKWDDVYSELRENLNPNSAVQKHVVDHAKQYVIKDTILLEDGRIIAYVPYWRRDSEYYVVNDTSKGVDRWQFYVDPTTKVLCQAGARYRYNRKYKKNPTHEVYQINKLEQYRNLPGGWFHIQLTEYQKTKTLYGFTLLPQTDSVFKNYKEKCNFFVEYGAENLRAHSKRQCGTKEIYDIIYPSIRENPEKYFTPKNFPIY